MEAHAGEKVARRTKSRTSPGKRDKENVKPRLVHEESSKREEYRDPTCEVPEHQIVYSENLLLKE